MKNLNPVSLLIATAFLASCATAPVKMSEPERLFGQESGIRLNAQMFMQSVAQHSPIPVTYEIENLRSAPIAVADIVPETTYDIQERTLTIVLGSEVPGNEFLPKLLVIAPGEKKSFTTKGRVDFAAATAAPRYIRLKLNFLGDVAPFAQLVDISEKAIHDPKLANELFPRWVEANETVLTNSVPMHYNNPGAGDDMTGRPPRSHYFE